MAKIKGPLMSVAASGQIAERLVFSQRGSGQQARFQMSQKDSITLKRETERAKLREAVSAYQDLSLEEKEYYHSLAVDKKFTGYNLFVKMYLSGLISVGDDSIYGFRNYGSFIYGKSL